LHARWGELFVRSEPRRQAGLYLEGLLSAVERKNGWQLAEHVGDARPWRTQRVLSHVQWDEAAARDLCRGYVVESLADWEGVLTGFTHQPALIAEPPDNHAPWFGNGRLPQRR